MSQYCDYYSIKRVRNNKEDVWVAGRIRFNNVDNDSAGYSACRLYRRHHRFSSLPTQTRQNENRYRINLMSFVSAWCLLNFILNTLHNSILFTDRASC